MNPTQRTCLLVVGLVVGLVGLGGLVVLLFLSVRGL
mgnify:CR=1 FL=1